MSLIFVYCLWSLTTVLIPQIITAFNDKINEERLGKVVEESFHALL